MSQLTESSVTVLSEEQRVTKQRPGFGRTSKNDQTATRLQIVTRVQTVQTAILGSAATNHLHHPTSSAVGRNLATPRGVSMKVP